jgi:DNA recombination protein RmuC
MLTTLVIVIISLVAGLLIGIGIGQFTKKKEIDYSREKLDAKIQEADQLKAEKESLRQELNTQTAKALKAESGIEILRDTEKRFIELQQQYLTGEKALSTLESKLRQAETALAQQKEELQKMHDQNRSEFRNLAQEILDQKEKAFTESNDKHLQNILNPFKTQLEDFRKRVDEVYDNEGKERHTLKAEIQRLVETSTKVGIEANNLTNALKTDVKKQGNWGEWILETILSNSGLVKDREFFMQLFIRDKAGNVIRDAEGKGLQPDATIMYPDERKVLADSKVSLVAWEKYVNAESADEQKTYLEQHISSIYDHINGLSAKNYPKYAEALDYVLMFVPIEPAFLEALKTDRDLWKYAYDKGIVMVSPTNLLAVLKIIADLWKVERQSKHAIEIAEKAGGLYDKFHGFVANMELIGKKIGESQDTYDKAFKQLSTGTGNIIRRIEELKKMGAKASKQLGDQLLRAAEDTEDETEETDEQQDPEQPDTDSPEQQQ